MKPALSIHLKKTPFRVIISSNFPIIHQQMDLLTEKLSDANGSGKKSMKRCDGVLVSPLICLLYVTEHQ